MPVKIDLDKLTAEHIRRCAPHFYECKYSAPCIIGTLAHFPDELEGDDIKSLAMARLVELPAGQIDEARELQSLFDAGHIDAFFSQPRIINLLSEEERYELAQEAHKVRERFLADPRWP